MSFDYTSVRYRSLENRSVVITGGASGIGEEMVKAFVAQGARVSFIDIATEAGLALAGETGAAFHACDVTDIPALRAVLARDRERSGRRGRSRQQRRQGRPARHDRGGAGLLAPRAGAQSRPPVLRDAGRGQGHGRTGCRAPSSCSARFPGCAAVPAWSGTRPRRRPSTA